MNAVRRMIAYLLNALASLCFMIARRCPKSDTTPDGSPLAVNDRVEWDRNGETHYGYIVGQLDQARNTYLQWDAWLVYVDALGYAVAVNRAQNNMRKSRR